MCSPFLPSIPIYSWGRFEHVFLPFVSCIILTKPERFDCERATKTTCDGESGALGFIGSWGFRGFWGLRALGLWDSGYGFKVRV